MSGDQMCDSGRKKEKVETDQRRDKAGTRMEKKEREKRRNKDCQLCVLCQCRLECVTVASQEVSLIGLHSADCGGR